MAQFPDVDPAENSKQPGLPLKIEVISKDHPGIVQKNSAFFTPTQCEYRVPGNSGQQGAPFWGPLLI